MKEHMNQIRKKIKKRMHPERYEHTLGVMYTAASLAMRYDEDIEKAMLAGLLHDCAKTEKYPPAELLALCRKYAIPVSESEEINPGLLHAKAGAFLAAKKYGVTDPEILDAIACHTTGKPAMSQLDKIIYIADFIEPGRNEADNLPRVRRLAFVNLDKCLLGILEDSLDYLKKKGNIIDPITAKTYKYYKKQFKK